jgi:hypothetical protein
VNTYTIERATEPVPLTGTVAGTPWEGAREAAIDTFPWDDAVRDAPATVRVLYDDEALYCQYQVPDTRIRADETELNGQVWTDSAIEWFFDPDPNTPEYVNLEVNCVGVPLLSWRTAEDVHHWIDDATAAEITVETSVDGPTIAPSPDDESWWLVARLPFAALEALTGESIAPSAGERWRGNFHSLSSDDTATVGVWNPIETAERNLHSPEYFGELRFA